MKSLITLARGLSDKLHTPRHSYEDKEGSKKTGEQDGHKPFTWMTKEAPVELSRDQQGHSLAKQEAADLPAKQDLSASSSQVSATRLPHTVLQRISKLLQRVLGAQPAGIAQQQGQQLHWDGGQQRRATLAEHWDAAVVYGFQPAGLFHIPAEFAGGQLLYGGRQLEG